MRQWTPFTLDALLQQNTIPLESGAREDELTSSGLASGDVFFKTGDREWWANATGLQPFSARGQPVVRPLPDSVFTNETE